MVVTSYMKWMILFVPLVLFFALPVNEMLIVGIGPSQSSTPVPAYVVHDPITIRNESDIVQQGWPGNGTAADPYIIEQDPCSPSVWDIMGGR